MSQSVEKIAADIESLSKAEYEIFLEWLNEYKMWERDHNDTSPPIVPMAIPPNVFAAPISGMWRSLRDIVWCPPYLHVLVVGAVIVLVLVVLVSLYISFGVLIQINSILAAVKERIYVALVKAKSFEMIGHATALGIMFLIYLPFAVIAGMLFLSATIVRSVLRYLAGLLDFR